MSRWIYVVALLLAGTLPLPASAFGWRAARTAYYYPAPVVAYSPVIASWPAVYCAPAYAVAVVAPAVALPRPLAQPVPAPPSPGPSTATPRTQEPPLNTPTGPGVRESRKVPSVTEAHSYFNAYALALPESAKPAGNRCRVTFWNLTEGAVTLKLGEQTFVIQCNGQTEPLELERQFVWRIDEREPQQERVPEGESGLVIVIRR